MAAAVQPSSPEAYPELEAIPPASSRLTASSTPSSASSLFPVPDWAVALFSAFPLRVWPAAEVISPAPTPPPRRPTLYVAPHLKRDGTLVDPSHHASTRTNSSDHHGWTSSDPVSLRWQMELLFRGVDFQVEFLDPSQSWGPGRQLPFLHLPPSFQPPLPPTSSRSASWLGARKGAVVPSLLTAAALPHFLDNYFPLHRPELGEKEDTHPIWKDRATELESRSWHNLLSGRVMAGVLLAVLLSPHSATTLQAQEQPCLSSILSGQLRTTFLDDQLRRISALNPKGRSEPTSRLPGWEVGLLGWIGASATAGTRSDAAADEVDDGFRYADPAVDEERVIEDAVKGIEALGFRVQDDFENRGSKWLLGSSRPTHLDALSFAIVHTVMSLCATPAFSEAATTRDKAALLRLKAAVEAKPWLVDWSRRVWKEMVRDRERR